MVGILVTGHGNFATGLTSALKLIAGEKYNLIGVDFKEGYSTEDLEEKIRIGFKELDSDEILVLSDLAGGSPFKVSATLSQIITNKNIKVLSGANLGMLIETALCREGMNLEELTEFALNSGKDSIKLFELKEKDNDIEEDGI